MGGGCRLGWTFPSVDTTKGLGPMLVVYSLNKNFTRYQNNEIIALSAIEGEHSDCTLRQLAIGFQYSLERWSHSSLVQSHSLNP